MLEPATDPLTGMAHRQLVDLLLSKVGSTGHNPTFIVIEGPSGVGKSRVVREVYSSLVQRQHEPRYWPGLAVAEHDVLATRKNMGPPRESFHWKPGALPDFLWWDISCDQLPGGDPLAVVRQFAPFLQQHLLPMALALAATRGLPSTVAGEVRDSLQRLLREGAGEVGMGALQLALGALDVAVPGLGWFVNRVGDGSRWLLDRRDADRSLRADTWIESPGGSFGIDIANQILQMTGGLLPGVIVIEDIHLMGPDLVELLRAIEQADTGLLVIATAWPEGRSRSVYADWLRSTEAVGLVRIEPLSAPSSHELAHFVTRRAPGTSPSEAIEIAGLWSNPYALLLLLSLDRVKARILANGGRLRLDDELKRVPRRVEDLYRSRLEELPEQVRSALAIAAGCMPEAANSLVGRFIADVVSRAAVRSRLFRGGPSAEAHIVECLRDAQVAYCWCLEPEPGTAAFREVPLQHAALEYLTDELISSDDSIRLRSCVVEVLREYVDSRRGDGYSLPIDDPVMVAACSWLLKSLDSRTDLDAAGLAAAICRARSLASVHHYTEATDFAAGMGLVGRAFDLAHPDLLALLGELGWWLAWAGRFDDSIDLLERLLKTVSASLGSGHPVVLALRARRAYISGMAAHIDEAISAFAELDSEVSTRTDVPARLRFHIRRQRARWLGTKGDYASAGAVLEPLAVSMMHEFGELDRDVLLADSNLAYFAAQANPELGAVLEEALLRYSSLIRRRGISLGPQDPDTLDARRNYACLLAKRDPATSLIELGQLLTDSLNVLERNSRHVLTTRLDLAVVASRCGEVRIATDAMGELLDIAEGAPGGAIGALPEYGRRDLPAAKLAEIAAFFEVAARGQGIARRTRALEVELRK
jgi:hypothetical protein